jgi:hypothetical protein
MKKVKTHLLRVHLKTEKYNEVMSSLDTRPIGLSRDVIKKNTSYTGASEHRKQDETRINKKGKGTAKTDKNAKIDISQEISDYERLRQRNIQERFKIFDQLRLHEAKSALVGMTSKVKN